MPGSRISRKEAVTKGHEGTLWDIVSVPNLDRDSTYIYVYIYHSLLNVTFDPGNFLHANYISVTVMFKKQFGRKISIPSIETL